MVLCLKPHYGVCMQIFDKHIWLNFNNNTGSPSFNILLLYTKQCMCPTVTHWQTMWNVWYSNRTPSQMNFGVKTANFIFARSAVKQSSFGCRSSNTFYESAEALIHCQGSSCSKQYFMTSPRAWDLCSLFFEKWTRFNSVHLTLNFLDSTTTLNAALSEWCSQFWLTGEEEDMQVKHTHFSGSSGLQQLLSGHISHTHTLTHTCNNNNTPCCQQSLQVTTSVSVRPHQWQNRWPSIVGAKLYLGCEVVRSWDASWQKLSWMPEWLCHWTWKYLFGSFLPLTTAMSTKSRREQHRSSYVLEHIALILMSPQTMKSLFIHFFLWHCSSLESPPLNISFVYHNNEQQNQHINSLQIHFFSHYYDLKNGPPLECGVPSDPHSTGSLHIRVSTSKNHIPTFDVGQR